MNLILFDAAELAVPLTRTDPRARHILEVLRRQVGDTFDCGLIDGPRGKATLAAVAADVLTLTFAWNAEPPPPPDPIALIVGLPRPQTARDILRDATALGAGALHFVATEKAEVSYAQSTLWSSGEWRRHRIDGAQQAFVTRLPAVTHGHPLLATLATLPAGGERLALDNYEAAQSLAVTAIATPVVLAIGGERGWSAHEREQLRAHGFTLVHLGRRVLRTETACIAALVLVRGRLGLM